MARQERTTHIASATDTTRASQKSAKKEVNIRVETPGRKRESTIRKPSANTRDQANSAKPVLDEPIREASTRKSPFDVLAISLEIDLSSLPAITNGELRTIADVDLPTLHGWQWHDKQMPPAAIEKLVHWLKVNGRPTELQP
ncbi:hypothetical protein [Adhaeretor mobilis]|uniref:hypothetical protein n=1 Tax=Adhaeretor mobilis TaxID=1930276 RepID=UPI001C54F97A|nr:hypothetical protein [Adhaeretor mobilis]